MFQVASNDDYGIEIYLTSSSDGSPCLTVEADDIELYEEMIVSSDDAKKTASSIYEKYLTDNVAEILSCYMHEKEATKFDIETEIEERELDLDGYVYKFIADVMGDDLDLKGDALDELLNDCKEHFLEYLARKHGLDIYRPMVLEDEDGNDFFEEFPYSCIIFDDESNPIYK